MKNKWLCSLSCFSSTILLAHPQEPSVVEGAAKFHSVNANHLQIQVKDKTIIEWKSFSNTPTEITQFIQPSKASAVLNRVTSGIKSEILGKLVSNGRLYLVNPAGIVIGNSGVVQTGGFIASTLQLNNKNFLREKKLFFKAEEEGSVINLGLIESEGDVALFAHSIKQQGLIAAPHARVFLGAGKSILLQPYQEAPLYIKHEIEETASIENTGFIQASHVQIASKMISHTGHIDALSITSNKGRIFLSAEQGKITSSGQLEAAELVSLNAEVVDLLPGSAICVPRGEASLKSRHMLTHAGRIAASSVTLKVEEKSPFVHTGIIDATNTISIEAPKFLNAGQLKTEKQGIISIHIQGASIETASAYLLAEGGSIIHHAGLSLFSSGHYNVGTLDMQKQGGAIDIFADQINLLDAHLDTTAPQYPGHISVGIVDNRLATSLYISPTTRLHHHANKQKKLGKLFLAPQAQWTPSLPAGLCSAAAGSSCTFGTIGEFLNPNPSSSGFGNRALPLSTGNVVIANPFDDLGAPDAGAVYLFNGTTGALISSLIGSSNGDSIGDQITSLTNGNYVTSSSVWDNGVIADAGAATWGSGVTGVSGTVSAANSLIGTTANDAVSSNGITALTNGNYVVSTTSWNNPVGPVASVGAATWGNGITGITGTVSTSNSLIGSTANDAISSLGITALTNGNYVVNSPTWDNPTGPVVNVGAATWGNGSTGITGTVSTSNSLVGTMANNRVSNLGSTALSNGNYVVNSSLWDNPTGPVADVGAATWGNGTTGITGTVSTSNSLVGTTASDRVGSNLVTALTNGNYVVNSLFWHNGVVANAGASTWGNGSLGTTGTVSTSNSLVGTTTNDGVGRGSIALTNGNYVVISPDWNNGVTAAAGAVTWGNGTTGTTGTVSTSNSLVGTTASDQISGVGTGVSALANGNYVVSSPLWHNGATANAGAATWGNGTTGTTGTVSTSNSLVGTQNGDFVSNIGITALTNGNYVVGSAQWSNGATANVGAATWGNGTTGVTGTVSIANSLIGSTATDQVSVNGITALSNGNYVVSSTAWNNPVGPVASVGALTWGDGSAGITGTVSAANSLTGSSAGDSISNSGIVEDSASCYAVVSDLWNNTSAAATDAGAVTLGSSITGIIGTVSTSNSFARDTSNTGLAGVSYNSAIGSLIMPFKTEGNGRVFFQIFSSVTPSTTTSLHVPSRGLADFRLSLSETFEEWGPFFLGGVLAEDVFAPCLTYKNVEHREYPSLIQEKKETQNKLTIKKKKRNKFFGR